MSCSRYCRWGMRGAILAFAACCCCCCHAVLLCRSCCESELRKPIQFHSEFRVLAKPCSATAEARVSQAGLVSCLVWASSLCCLSSLHLVHILVYQPPLSLSSLPPPPLLSHSGLDLVAGQHFRRAVLQTSLPSTPLVLAIPSSREREKSSTELCRFASPGAATPTHTHTCMARLAPVLLLPARLLY